MKEASIYVCTKIGAYGHYQYCANGSGGPQGHGHPAAEDLECVAAVGREDGRRQVEGGELLATHDRDDPVLYFF